MQRELRVWVLCAVVAVTAGCGKADAQDEYSKAVQLLQGGEIRAAVIHLKNVLKQEPAHAEARAKYAEILLENGEIDAAIQTIRSHGAEGELPAALKELLALGWMRRGSWKEVLQFTEDREFAALGPVQRAARMEALARTGSLDEAKALATSSPVESAEHPVLAAAQLRVMIADLGVETALQKLVPLLERFPESTDLWELKGDLAQSVGRAEEAIDAYSRALGAIRYPNQSMLKRAMIWLATGKTEAAKEDLAQLLKVFPRHPGVNYALGVIALQEQKYKEAAGYLEVARGAGEAYPRARLFESRARAALGEMENARTLAEQYHARRPDDPDGTVQLASMLLVTGDSAQALELIGPVYRERPDDSRIGELYAGILAAEGRTEEAARKLLELYNETPEERLGVKAAMLLFASGRLEEASQLLQGSSGSLEGPVSGQLFHISQVLSALKSRDHDLALKRIQAFREAFPNIPTSWELAATVWLHKGEPDRAEQELQALLERFPRNVEALRQLASFSLNRGDRVQAMSFLQRARELAPQNASLTVEMARLMAGQGDYGGADKLLFAAWADEPDNLTLLVPLLELRAKTGRLRDAEELWSRAPAALRRAPQAMSAMARVAQLKGDLVEAEKLLKDAVSQKGKTRDQIDLAMIQARAGKRKEAVAGLLAAADSGQDALTTATVLERLVALGATKEARNLFERRKTVLGERQRLAAELLLARSRGDSDSAHRLAGEIWQRYPDTQSLSLYMRALNEAGKRSEALSVADQWLAEHPDDAATTFLRAGLLETMGKTAASIAAYRRALELDPDNPYVLNALAWALRDSRGSAAEAVTLAKKAFSLAPNDPAVADTLMTVLVGQSSLDEAAQIADQVLSQRPADPVMRYHRAVVARLQGDNEQARTLLSGLLASNQPFMHRDKARQLLEGMQ